MITIPRLSVFLLLALVYLPVQQTYADELLMRDGSRLLGKVVKREGKTLEFETSYAGVIKVKWDEVSELHADEPMKLMLKDESTLNAQHIKNTETGILLDDNIEADQSTESLAQSELEYINPDPWRTGDGYKLTGHINFALEKERGNTDEDEIDIDGDLTWRFLKDRFRMFGEFERDRKNNKKTKDKWKLDNSYDHFLTRKWFAGAYLGFEHDQFADLNLRTIIGPKVGYQWFESKEMNLRTEAGPMYTDEDFDNDPDDDYLALGWGINFDKYLFGEFMQVYHRQGGLWSMDDTSDLVWNTWTGLRFPLVLGFVASTEMQVEYDSGAADEADDLDTTYSLKLGYAW
jgi:putative salt-induced outer membrane protein YdiY